MAGSEKLKKGAALGAVFTVVGVGTPMQRAWRPHRPAGDHRGGTGVVPTDFQRRRSPLGGGWVSRPPPNQPSRQQRQQGYLPSR